MKNIEEINKDSVKKILEKNKIKLNEKYRRNK